MTAYYAGSMIFDAGLDEFREPLDPRKWSEHAPDSWLKSYFTRGMEKGFSEAPEPHETRQQGDVFAAPFDELFFEDVIVDQYRFRNVLEIAVRPQTTDQAGRVDSFGYDYRQHQCLSTSRLGEDSGDPGGIDVDHGFVQAKTVAQGRVEVSIEKTVRFTRPDTSVEDLNALAHVEVPLVLDVWLQTLLFNDD